MSKEVITIERPGPYGVLVDGEWYGISEDADLTPDQFKKGGVYTVLTNTSNKTGKKYIQKLVDADESEAVEEEAKPAFKKKFGGFNKGGGNTGGGVGRGRNPEESESILRQAMYKSCAESPGLVPFILKKEDFVPVVSEMAEALILKIKGGKPSADEDAQ